MGQTRSAAEANTTYFEGNEAYVEWIGSIDSYKLQGETLTRVLADSGHLVDVGNGGAFDYDTSVADQITAVDLFVPPDDWAPENTKFVAGSALDLPLEDGVADTVVMVMLLHHLVGDEPGDLERNALRAIEEAKRVLKPGGRFVLAESCVPRWFARIEPALFKLLARWAARKDHPPTYQLPPAAVTELVARVFGDCESTERIPMGRWTAQLGRKWPVLATPARAWLFQARNNK